MEIEAMIPNRGEFPTKYLVVYLLLGLACLLTPHAM